MTMRAWGEPLAVRRAKADAAKAATVATIRDAIEPEREWWTGEIIDPPEEPLPTDWVTMAPRGAITTAYSGTIYTTTSTGGWAAPASVMYDLWDAPSTSAVLDTSLDDDTDD